MLGAFSGWLNRLVQHGCCRRGRKVFDDAPYVEGRLEPWLARRDETALCTDLVAALESLSPHGREFMRLRGVQEMTIEEIPARTGPTRANLKSPLHRARALARQCLLAG